MEYVWTTRKTFLVINFLHLIRTKIIIKEFIFLRHQVLQDRFQCRLVQGLLSQEMKIDLRAQFLLPTFARRPSTVSSEGTGGISTVDESQELQ